MVTQLTQGRREFRRLHANTLHTDRQQLYYLHRRKNTEEIGGASEDGKVGPNGDRMTLQESA